MCKSCLGSYQDFKFLLWILRNIFEHTYSISTMDVLDHFWYSSILFLFYIDQVILQLTYFLARGNTQTNRCSVQRLCSVSEMETMCSHGVERNAHEFSAYVFRHTRHFLREKVFLCGEVKHFCIIIVIYQERTQTPRTNFVKWSNIQQILTEI